MTNVFVGVRVVFHNGLFSRHTMHTCSITMVLEGRMQAKREVATYGRKPPVFLSS